MRWACVYSDDDDDAGSLDRRVRKTQVLEALVDVHRRKKIYFWYL